MRNFSQLDLRRYSRAEIMVSDHRPVYALLHAQVRVVDRARQTAVREEALKSAQRSFVTEDGEGAKVSCLREPELIGDASDLPPPSDETQSWWQDTGECSSDVIRLQVLTFAPRPSLFCRRAVARASVPRVRTDHQSLRS